MFARPCPYKTDSLIVRYFELLTRVPLEEVKEIEKGMKAGAVNPRDVKMRLAREIIAMYHSLEAAEKAQEKFELVFSKRDIPEDIPEIETASGEVWLPNAYG
jgi:tyrosyl-tRNA synthetase